MTSLMSAGRLVNDPLLICTDLDRTLIPNGTESESMDARKHFAVLACRPEVTLAYVSGRHIALVKQAINNYQLPVPDYVIGDVGTTVYKVKPGQPWERQQSWEEEIVKDWPGQSHSTLKAMLSDISALRLQEYSKQNRFKLSYYVPLHTNHDAINQLITHRFESVDVHANLIWSVDEPVGIGLLDILPARASKYHAVEALMKMHDFDFSNTVFCGDSGNDIEVLASPVPAVLVANSQPEVQELATRLSEEMGNSGKLYIASGGFMNMNGNYSAGMLEGIAHYHPSTVDWMDFEPEEKST